MRIASIDIGTNTVLMLIADCGETGEFRVVRDEHAIVRLGRNVDSGRRILPESIERLVAQLSVYADIARREGCQDFIATGTSALRDAANREEVLKKVVDRTGIRVTILDGGEEAELTFRGAVFGIPGLNPSEHVAVVDIGGGSTEVTLGKPLSVISSNSVDIGSVRLTERFWRTYPAEGRDLHRCRAAIRDGLKSMRHEIRPSLWVGVAGTLTTCAAIALRLRAFDSKRVDGFALTRETVGMILDDLSSLSLEELRNHPQIHRDRADIIVAGVTILHEVLQEFDVNSIQVSTRGLRFGSLLRLAGSQSQ